VSVRSERAARARNRKIEGMLKTMQPLRGGLWLAFDRSTGFHWVVDAADVRLAPGVRYAGSSAGTSGVVTVRSRTGDPVFQIEEADTLEWDEPEQRLKIREGGLRGSEIVLERIADLNAPLIAGSKLGSETESGEPVRGINIEREQYVVVDDALLTTGDPEIDATLTVIESSLVTRGGEHGSLTREILERMNREIDQIARNENVRSFVWLTTLRQRVSSTAKAAA
jgi:hypothetical protein